MTKLNNVISPEVQSKVSEMTGKDSKSLDGVYSNLLNMVTCDSDCQKRMNIDSLRQKWKDAELAQKNAPDTTQTAEKNYYVTKDGEEGYNQVMFKKYTNIADKKKKRAEFKQNELTKNINLLINEYKNDQDGFDKLKDLFEIRILENKTFKQKLDNQINITQTNDRKVVYEDWATDGLKSIYIFILVFYIIICIVYLIFKIRNPDFDYKKIITWVPVLILILIPIFIKLIAQFIKTAYNFIIYYLQNNGPKNVYSDL